MPPREKLWVVRDGDGRTVAEIVRRAGEDARAIEEGRVFVGKKRASAGSQAVAVGDAVRIGPPARRSERRVEILFREDGLVACVKPAGLPTVPDRASASGSLVALVAGALGKKNTDLRVTSRLDRDVSGVVVFALDAAAEERLKRARAEGRYQRRYVALATLAGDRTLDEAGTWNAAIGRASDPRLRLVRGLEAKAAMTRWCRVATTPPASDPQHGGALVVAMLAVDPVTGRTHQIRVHASDAGAPLLGDRDYGGSHRIVLRGGTILSTSRIALHAARVVVPGGPGVLEARAPVPPELARIWNELGGDAGDWERAIAVEIPHDESSPP